MRVVRWGGSWATVGQVVGGRVAGGWRRVFVGCYPRRVVGGRQRGNRAVDSLNSNCELLNQARPNQDVSRPAIALQLRVTTNRCNSAALQFSGLDGQP